MSEISSSKQGLQDRPVPLRLLLIITALLLITETVISVVLFQIMPLPEPWAWMLDVVITTLLFFPVLYYFSFRQLLKHIEQRKRVEIALRQAQTDLEKQVAERTSELLAANRSLELEINERRRTETQMRLQSTALEAAANGIVITDQQGFIQWTNPAFSQMSGYSQDELCGQNPRLLKSGQHSAEYYRKMWETILAGQVWKGETINRRKDGALYVEEQTIAPVRDDSGTIRSFIAIKNEITQRKRAEQERAAERQRLFSLLEELPGVVYVHDQNYHIRFSNRRFRERFGDPGNLPCYEVIQNRETPCPGCQTLDVLTTHTPVEWEWTSPEGHSYQFYDYPFTDVDGSVLALELGFDVTERKRIESALEQRNQELLNLSKAERRQRQFSDALAQAALMLSTSLHSDAVLDGILEQIQQVIPCRAAALLLREADNLRLVRKRGLELRLDDYLEHGFPIDRFPTLEQVVSQSQPVLVEDSRQLETLQRLQGLEWVRSYLSAPLKIDTQVLGVISLFDDQPFFFRPEMTVWLQAFVAHAALAIQNARLYQAEHSARQLAEVLSGASLAMSQNLKLDLVLETLLEFLERLVPFHRASVLLREDEDRFLLQIQRGDVFENESELAITMDAWPQLRTLIEQRQVVTVQRSATGWDLPLEQADGFSLLIPMVSAERVFGICRLDRDPCTAFNAQDLRFANALVNQAAVVVENVWLFEQVQAGRERMQQLLHRLVEIQENERRYVARELHDEAGQALTSLMVGLRLLEREAGEPDSVQRGIGNMKQMLNDVIENLDRLARDLRPASLDHAGLVPALQDYVLSMGEKHELIVQFESLGWNARLPHELETMLYRIVQEALLNVVRHAHASHVDVLLERRQNKLVVLIEDDGVGFDPEQAMQQGRLGLVGLKERVEMLGGELVVESTPGKGTTLHVEVQYADPDHYR